MAKKNIYFVAEGTRHKLGKAMTNAVMFLQDSKGYITIPV